MPAQPNFDGVEFERVRRTTDLPIVRLKERLDDAYYGDVVADHLELAGQFAAGKHRYQNGWLHGVSRFFVARRSGGRPTLVFDIRPGNPNLCRKGVWNGTDYTITNLGLSPQELHQRLSDFADQMLTVRQVDANTAQAVADRYSALDAGRKATANAALTTYRNAGLDIDDTEAV